jgi:hypothetical protein
MRAAQPVDPYVQKVDRLIGRTEFLRHCDTKLQVFPLGGADAGKCRMVSSLVPEMHVGGARQPWLIARI